MSQYTVFACFIAICIIGCVVGTSIQRDEEIKGLVHKPNVLVDGKPGKEHKSKYIYYLSGYDYENRPVIVMEWGRWDIRGLAEEGGDGPANFQNAVLNFVELIQNGYFNSKYNGSEYEDGIVGIIDFDGLNLRQIGTAESMKLFVRSLSLLEGAYTQFAYGYIVNANPLVHQLIQASKPYMGKFLERMEVYGSNSHSWIPKILKQIPRDQLHPAYGGKESFKPVAVFNLM